MMKPLFQGVWIVLSLIVFCTLGCGSNDDDSGSNDSTTKSWGVAQLIEFNETGYDGAADIGVDDTGNIYVVWVHSDGVSDSLWTTQYINGSWDSEQQIDTDDYSHITSPMLAVNTTGKAICTWVGDDDTNKSVHANINNGRQWDDPFVIADSLVQPGLPQAAIDSNGNALVLWVNINPILDHIWSRYFDGSTWGDPEILPSGDESWRSMPRVGFDGNGNAIALWKSDTNGGVFANHFDGSSWSDPIGLFTNTYTGQRSLAVNTNGQACAMWSVDQYESSPGVYAAMFDGTNWSSAVLISSSGDGEITFENCAINADGKAAAIWTQRVDGIYRAVVNHFDGTAWGDAVVFDQDDDEVQSTQIAIDNSDNITAVWTKFQGTISHIRANRFDDTSWGSPQWIENDETNSASFPAIIVDNQGNVTAVWQQYDGSVLNIWANRFDN